MHRSPGWAPSGMECPWVGVLGRGREETASHSGLLGIPDPDTALTCPKGRSPGTFLDREGKGALGTLDFISQPHAEGQRPGGEGGLNCNRLS